MRDWLASIDNWWLIVALLLAMGEMIVPGIYLLWIALALALVGLVHLFFPLDWQVEAILAAITIPISLFIGHKIIRRSTTPSPVRALNRRGQRYFNQIFTLDEPIKNRSGKIKIGDTIWKIRAEVDLSAGEKIRIVGNEGPVLLVVPEKNG